MDRQKSAEHLATAHNAMQQISAMLELHTLALAGERIDIALNLLAQIRLTLLEGQHGLVRGVVEGDDLVALAFGETIKTCHPAARPTGAPTPLKAARLN